MKDDDEIKKLKRAKANAEQDLERMENNPEVSDESMTKKQDFIRSLDYGLEIETYRQRLNENEKTDGKEGGPTSTSSPRIS